MKKGTYYARGFEIGMRYDAGHDTLNSTIRAVVESAQELYFGSISLRYHDMFCSGVANGVYKRLGGDGLIDLAHKIFVYGSPHDIGANSFTQGLNLFDPDLMLSAVSRAAAE